jgi:hypothetical protein
MLERSYNRSVEFIQKLEIDDIKFAEDYRETMVNLFQEIKGVYQEGQDVNSEEIDREIQVIIDSELEYFKKSNLNFRELLQARLLCRDNSLSNALRDEHVSERNDKRKVLVEKRLAEFRTLLPQ